MLVSTGGFFNAHSSQGQKRCRRVRFPVARRIGAIAAASSPHQLRPPRPPRLWNGWSSWRPCAHPRASTSPLCCAPPAALPRFHQPTRVQESGGREGVQVHATDGVQRCDSQTVRPSGGGEGTGSPRRRMRMRRAASPPRHARTTGRVEYARAGRGARLDEPTDALALAVLARSGLWTVHDRTSGKMNEHDDQAAGR